MTRSVCRSIALAAALVVPAGLSVSLPSAAAVAATCPVRFLGLHGLNEESDLHSPPINATWKTFESAVAAKADRPKRDPICGTGYRAGTLDLTRRTVDALNVKCSGSPHCYSGQSTTQGGQFLASRVNTDWNNRTYHLTCDDIVSKAAPVTVRNGKGTARGSGIGDYERWQVQIQRITRGTVPRLGDVTAVLFSCSPQPSNFSLQELRVYRTTDGREVGRTPTFQVAELPPQYQPDTVRIIRGLLLADVKFYGSGDTHATGPSILRHVTWRWDGSQFVKQSEIDARNPKRTDLSTHRVTVNGIGPLRLGMSRSEAEQAIGARIPEGPGGPDCKDLSIEGGPDGLLLRFSNDDRLVAVYVLSPSSISTASGIHRGSTRAEVLATYAGEIEEPSTDELVFTPSGAQFQGKVITFAMDDNGEVDRFIAGEEEFAVPLPCGSD
ncbi:hypothetical protein [Streptomyces yerevanensis]|uniref:hypothetical protein n=1 Tax=Streptomyces yerevanensis TaxID=66378 RepID=UPI00052635EE|nr:hypothetical protein [Streptomyces yerevanensis]